MSEDQMMNCDLELKEKSKRVGKYIREHLSIPYSVKGNYQYVKMSYLFLQVSYIRRFTFSMLK